MSKSGFASEKVMRNYLSALLVDEEEAKVAQAEKEPLRPVEKLLEKVNVLEQAETPSAQTTIAKPAEKIIAPPVVNIPPVETPEQVMDIVETANQQKAEEKGYRSGEFQALFFDVAGLTVAVPLTELGGIHKMDKLSNLPGKPDWFMGVMLHRDEKINVVNTALWVMPEKYDEAMENELDYQYIIMLDNSNWGLACGTLVNTVVLNQDDVKWREQSGRRPWLAGLIKERMCALLDVEAMIELLEQGQDSGNDTL